MSLIYLDILHDFQADPNVGEATLRERALIEAVAKALFKLENELYWAKQATATRPEAAR